MNVFNRLNQRLAPTVRLLHCKGGIEASVWAGNKWRELDENERNPAQGRALGRTVLLVPEDKTCFRLREFPGEVLSRSELSEAVALDVESWSPWGAGSGRYYWAVREEDTWRVAIWAWDAAALNNHGANEASILQQWHVTHIVPESAWRLASLSIAGTSWLAIWPSSGGFTYAWVGRHRMLPKLAIVQNRAEAQRFWRSLGPANTDITACYLLDAVSSQAPPWLPETPVREVASGLPPASLLRQARIDDARDWENPAAWRYHLIGLAVCSVMWLGAPSLVLWQRGSQVDAALQQTRASAEAVINLRDQVRRMRSQQLAFTQLQRRQQRELLFLASLSEKLPDDAWLVSLTDDGQQVDIRGKAKDAAAIGAILLKVDGVDHVSYLGDIRPDPANGYENFSLRLHFTVQVPEDRAS